MRSAAETASPHRLRGISERAPEPWCLSSDRLKRAGRVSRQRAGCQHGEPGQRQAGRRAFRPAEIARRSALLVALRTADCHATVMLDRHNTVMGKKGQLRAGSPVGEALRRFADENLTEAEAAIGTPGLADAVA